MEFKKYILQKINYILIYVIYTMLLFAYLKALGNGIQEIFFIILITTAILIAILIQDFYQKKKYFKNLEKIIDNLDKKYLLAEIMEKPYKIEYAEFYKLLKKANKSMIEEVSQLEKSQKEYKEYIESWVHEIKIPITSSMLLYENNKSELTRKANTYMQEINNYVEQALFYARQEQVSNDYIIKKTDLQLIINNVISKNKNLLIQENIKLEIEDNLGYAYSDEKWLEFIINQIVINAIKYKKEENAQIKIYSQKNQNNICLYIQDNGIGIKESEIKRVFNKGFTGTNGRMKDKKSTGIGLYLCKNLCKKIGAEIEIKSKINEFTTLKIILPGKFGDGSLFSQP